MLTDVIKDVIQPFCKSVTSSAVAAGQTHLSTELLGVVPVIVRIMASRTLK
jgi:hypothetical protein